MKRSQIRNGGSVFPAMPENKKSETFACPSCSAEMEFDPESGGMKCRFCGHAQALAVGKSNIKAHPFAEILAKADGAQLTTLSEQALEVGCDGCGSAVVFQPPEVAGICPFCGTPIVAQPKAADPLIAPDAVLPAKVPKQTAQAEVRQWLAKRWFAPSALQRMAQQERIGGVYLPFWTYASDTASEYRGERGDHYWETEDYEENDGQGGTVRRTRQVQRTRWWPAAGRVSRSFADVLIAATRSVAESRLDALQPWDLDNLCPYDPEYLAGFKAQRYQIQLPEGFEEAKQAMRHTIERDVERDIGGDEQRIESLETQYANVTFRHLLLPLWIGAYRFQGKAYQVIVNARTGDVQGERPYSAWKIVLLVAAVLLLLLLLAQVLRH